MKSSPTYFIVGVPVAQKRTMIYLKLKAHKVEAIFEPSNANFICVEQYYENFSPVMDIDVVKALGTKTNSETLIDFRM
jgi:predicted phosphoribosyltransferase